MGHILPLFNRLGVRVFLSIWVSMALLVGFTTIIPHLDQRRILSIPKEEERIYQENLLERLLIGQKMAAARGAYSERGREERKGERKGERRHHDRYLIIIPHSLEERYRAIHHIKEDLFIGFIINTIDLPNAHQQSTGKEVIMGPFHHPSMEGNHLYIVAPAPPQSYYLARLFDAPLLLAGLITLIGLPIAAQLAHSLTRPVIRLQQAAERVALGDWEQDATLEQGPVEYRCLGRSFNHMVAALTRAEEEKNRLFANLSHELRTPLTRIKLTNSLLRRKLEKGAYPIPTQSETERIEENINLIEDRIQAMLSLSKQIILSRDRLAPYAFRAIIFPLLEETRFEAGEHGKALDYTTMPNVTLSLNLELFCSGLENILRNAIYYAHHQITLEAHIRPQPQQESGERKRELAIIITDDGPGVPEEILPRLFEAFYRGERPEGMTDYGGSGLGLAIAKQMADAHRGTITAENCGVVGSNHGLKITITLPIVD